MLGLVDAVVGNSYDCFGRSKYWETRRRRIIRRGKSDGASRVYHGCGDMVGYLAGLVCCLDGAGCILLVEVLCASDGHL